MFNQFGQFVPDMQQFRQPVQQSIIRVNGRNGAEAYQMAPNSNCLLLDDTAPIVWLKSTDGAGYPQLTPYTITPHQPEPKINPSDLLARITRLEEIVNGKSDSSGDK